VEKKNIVTHAETGERALQQISDLLSI